MAQDRPSVPTGPPAATPLASPPAVPAGDGTGVRFTTELGDILIGVFTESSPVAATNFIALAASGYYDGTLFHRVVPGFVIQGGSPTGTSVGGPGYTIQDEPVVGTYARGIVAMGRTPLPDSQGSQFFIVLDDAARRSLDATGTYAIIGRVLEGMDVVDAIAAQPNSPGSDAPVTPVRIVSTTMETVVMPVEVEPTPEPATDDVELEARLPATVTGVAIERMSITGHGLRAEAGVEALVTSLDTYALARGQQLDAVSLLIAGADLPSGDAVEIRGLRVRGSQPVADDITEFARILVEGDAITLTPTTVAGHDVYSVEGTGLPVQMIGLVSGDTVWLVLTGDAAARDELVGALAAD